LRPVAAARKIFYLPFLLPMVAVWLAAGARPALAQRPLQNAAPAPGQANTQRPYIENIYFVGNRTYPRDTLLAHIFSRPGDPYNPEGLRRDFHALWNTGYFEDVQLIVQDDPKNPNGKLVYFWVVERPVIRLIKYNGNKSVTESDILDAFKNAKLSMTNGVRFDPTKVTRAAVIIQELLAAHGRQFATVKPTFERIPAANAIVLTFNINEGPKVKVGKIEFTGNHAFKRSTLVYTMKNTRPYSIPLYLFYIPVMSKTYDEGKLDEDLETGVRAYYQNHGYFRVLVGDPKTKTVDYHRGGLPIPFLPLVGRQNGKRTDITIPIEEGSKYKLGNLYIVSSDPERGLFFKPDYLKRLFPLKAGDLFQADKVRKSLKTYGDLYGAWGYIDFSPQPSFDIDEKTKTVNLTLNFDQGKQYYVRRIEFSGNTTTRDKVIRRELLLNEGDLFNNHLWEISLLRLNQLGYFNELKPADADVKRDPKQGTVDILLKVKEKGKQSVGLTGGLSGIAGDFIGLNYQTKNFLGLGETLTFESELGNIQRQFVFGFTEPYLFDRNISTGFTLFSTFFSYDQAREYSLLLGQQVSIPANIAENYNINSKGFTVFASAPVRRFSFARLGLNYSLTKSTLSAFSSASQTLFEDIQFTSVAGPSQLTGIVASKVQPTISYSTVNNPINPTGGRSLFFGMGFEGGPLGGNVKEVTPSIEASYFHPINHHRNVLAFHLLGAFATGYGGDVMPPFDRFYVGGENEVRGFDFYSISPWVFLPTLQPTAITYFNPTMLGANGQPTQESLTVPLLHFVATRPGGDSQIVGNFEYRIPIVGNYFGMDLFYDAGLDGILRHSQLQLNPTALTSLRGDFPNANFPGLQIPAVLPIAPGTNFKLHTSTGIEFVVQLPIIQAPFRVYYAFNLNRQSTDVVEPPGAYFLNPAIQAGLPPHVFQSQILPQIDNALQSLSAHYAPFLFEQARTIRFTVSRTF
jgi:outer membrane protein insertion porin family